MALKDWKKIDNLKEHVAFENKRDDELYIEIFTDYTRKGKWLLALSDRQKEYSFKSKLQALKFAKQYMEEH